MAFGITKIDWSAKGVVPAHRTDVTFTKQKDLRENDTLHKQKEKEISII